MFLYVVVYDLNQPGRRYDDVIQEIQQTDAFHMGGSEWLVATTETAAQLATRLHAQMDENDSYFVAEIVKSQGGSINWDWRLRGGATAWLRKRGFA